MSPRPSTQFQSTTKTRKKENHNMPRHKFLALALVVAAVAVCLGLSACSLQSSSASAVSSAARSRIETATKSQSVTTVTAKACLDATTSSYGAFAIGVKQALASALSKWTPSLQSGQPTAAVPATPALNFYVRQVTTNSYSTQDPSLDLVIAGTPALPAPPKVTDPSLAADQLTWSSKESKWRAAVKRARKEDANAVDELKRYPLDHAPNHWSAISGCTAALAAEGSENASTRLLLASDLEENRPPVLANYAGASMLIDENCPGTAPSCTSRATSWTTRFHRQHMGVVTVVLADAATQAVENWLLGARS